MPDEVIDLVVRQGRAKGGIPGLIFGDINGNQTIGDVVFEESEEQDEDYEALGEPNSEDEDLVYDTDEGGVPGGTHQDYPDGGDSDNESYLPDDGVDEDDSDDEGPPALMPGYETEDDDEDEEGAGYAQARVRARQDTHSTDDSICAVGG